MSDAALRSGSANTGDAFFEIETVGVIFFDMEGRLRDANDAFLAMSGYTRADLEAGCLTWQRMTPPEWMEASKRALAELLATGRTTPYEKQYIRKDGSRWWGLFAAKRLSENIVFEFVVDVSEHKRAEARLRDSEERFRVLVENWAQAVWEADAQGFIATDSPSWRAYTGQTLGEFLGDDWFDAIHPDDRADAERQWREAVHARHNYDAEYRLRRATGGWRWTNVRAAPLLAADGSVRKWVGMNIDISRRKEAEEATRRYRMLIEQSSDFIAMVGLDGRVIFVTEGARHIVGSPADFDWSKVSIPDFFLPEDRSFVEHVIMPQLLAGKEWIGEFRFRHFVTGEAIPVWYNAFPIKDAAGRVTALATVTRDISLQKRAEVRLRESEALLRQVLDVGRMGAWEWDFRTNRSTWSDGVYSSLGYAPTEVEAHHELYLSHVHPDDRQALEAALQHSLRTHEVYAHSYRIIRCNGEIVWCESRGVYEYDDDNKPVRMIGITADVTERHQSEAALQELQAELSHVLRQNAMGMMATTLAHELNQPLTAVTSYVETARAMLARSDRKTVEMIGTALDKAAAQAVRAGQILHRLREFVSRGDAGKTIEDLSELISDAAGLALTGTGDKGIHVNLRLGRPTFVLADRVQIQQVLVNLIRNAVEAMADGERCELTIASSANADNHAEVSVADTGPGLPSEVTEQLFQPFVSTKREGMGLGLSICRTIVEAHGGRLWAEPNKGGGTVFIFTLPLAHRPAADQ